MMDIICSQDDATEAKNALNGTEMDDRKIRVDFSITKRAHTPTPGMYMGRPTSGGGRWAVYSSSVQVYSRSVQ